MQKYKLFVIRGMLCCILVLMAGCTSSELVDIWSDSSFQAPSLNKILVISISRNSVQRHIWEDAYSIELAKHAVAAIPSYSLFPDAVPDTNQLIQIVKSNGFDGVLVNRRLPQEMDTQYMHGDATTGQSMKFDLRRMRFVTYYRDIEHSDYTDSQEMDIRAIHIWATRNEGQMIWSATSRTSEPNSMQKVQNEIVRLVMSDLTKKGIIASKM